MIKKIISYYVVDELETLSYPIVVGEYAKRENAEAALKPLRHIFPKAHICKHENLYDLNDPKQHIHYERHLQRLL